MKYTLIIKEEADLDITDAWIWYEERKVGLGDELIQELEDYFSILEVDPHVCQVRYGNYRLFPLKRFPYVIVYEIEEKEVIVYAIFHTSRDPKKRHEE